MWTDWSSRVFVYVLSWLHNMTRGYNPLISMLCSVSMAPIKNVTGSHTHFIRGRLVKRLLFIFALDILWRSMASCFPILFESKPPSGKSPRPFQAGHWPLPMELILTQCDIFCARMPNVSKSNEDSGQVTTSPFDKSHECRLLKTSLQNCCDCSLLLAKRLTVYWPGSSFESKMGSLTCKKQSPKVWQKNVYYTSKQPKCPPRIQDTWLHGDSNCFKSFSRDNFPRSGLSWPRKLEISWTRDWNGPEHISSMAYQLHQAKRE